MGTWLPDWGNQILQIIKSGNESHGTWTQEGLRWQGPAATVNYRPVLSSERVPIITNLQLSKEKFKEKKKMVMSPTPGQTD
jgi:hypothetical protein